MVLDILEDIGVNESTISAAARSFARTAQKKKNKLKEKLEEEKQAAYYRLLKQGILRSSVLDSIYEKLQARYTAEAQQIADDLKFQIGFLGDDAIAGDGSGQYKYPYNPDYSLDYAGRYYAVYNYYMAMTDAKVRFALFQADTLAPNYLGDFYATLYDRLKSYADYS